MNHFNFKSLVFYGTAITSVLLLFKTVTAYGENNLKAPPVINGVYRLTLAQNLSNCEQSQPLNLNLQQSGIYFNASLLPANLNTKTSPKEQIKPSITGIIKNQELNLSGKIDSSMLCHTATPPNTPDHLVTIQMKIADRGNLTGQLTLSSIPQPWQFTALAQPTEPESHK